MSLYCNVQLQTMRITTVVVSNKSLLQRMHQIWSLYRISHFHNGHASNIVYHKAKSFVSSSNNFFIMEEACVPAAIFNIINQIICRFLVTKLYVDFWYQNISFCDRNLVYSWCKLI